MEYEKLGLSLPNEIYLYTLRLSMDGRPSVHSGTSGPTFRFKDVSQLEVSLRWRNISNRFFP